MLILIGTILVGVSMFFGVLNNHALKSSPEAQAGGRALSGLACITGFILLVLGLIFQ